MSAQSGTPHRPDVVRALDDAEGPEVYLLDARVAGLDQAGLRAWARALTPHASHVTRSYSHPYALLSWHDGPVGVDIERIGPCDAEFARSICTPAERRASPSQVDLDAYFTSLWSSKEAIAKAFGDPLARDPRRLEAPMLWPAGRAGPWRATRLHVDDGHVAWLCWREPGRSPAGLYGVRSARTADVPRPRSP